MGQPYKKAPAELVKAAEKVGEDDEIVIAGEIVGQTRASAALSLRIDGASFEQIAKALEFQDGSTARRAVEYALASITHTPEEVEHVRYLNARRLERILASLMRRATSPKDPDHLAYARTALVTIDRHIKLYGADAPAKMNVTYNPTVGQIEEWVMATARQVHGEIAEADILDVEVEED